jgi:acetylornithine deacetylase/succinyl-diaminopimelate desuccinylase-like protein
VDNWPDIAAATNQAVAEGLDDLMAAIRIPSVSARGQALRESAEYLRGLLAADGWTADLLQVKSNPVVFAEIGDGPSTILLYGHHDVQPPEPLEAWTTPPFQPVIREGRIYGRGAGDDKGQFFGHLFAVRGLMKVLGRVPVRVKLLLDGEEESGNQNIGEVVGRLRPRLGADFMFTIDGPAALDGRPRITYGFRGLLKLKLRIRTMTRNVHSGHWGNLAPDAAFRLAQALAELKDPDGRVRVPGFYDRARPPDAAEIEALEHIPFDESAAVRQLGAVALAGPYHASPMERMMFLPSLTVTGMAGGHHAGDAQSSIPAEASATIEIRYVPDMDAAQVVAQLRAWLAEHAPEAALEAMPGRLPSRTPMGTENARRVASAVARGYARDPVLLPSSGGSSPEHLFTRDLGLHSYWTHLANPDMQNHAPDENLSLDSLRALSRASASVLYEFAGG